MSKEITNTEVRVGDVFLVPLDGTWSVGGHVIAIRENEELYIAIFGTKLPCNESDPETAISGSPVLLTLSFDAKLFHGEWPVIGNIGILPEQYPELAFKVKHSGIVVVESRDKKFRRTATESDLEILHNRSVASPMIVEDAIKAHFGIGDWSESFEKRRAEYAFKTSALVG